jgi:hypothetical protein
VCAALPIEQRVQQLALSAVRTPVSVGFRFTEPLQKTTKDVYNRSFVDIFGVCTNASFRC